MVWMCNVLMDLIVCFGKGFVMDIFVLILSLLHSYSCLSIVSRSRHKPRILAKTTLSVIKLFSRDRMDIAVPQAETFQST
jgi:CDP-diglyceride synthetase